MRCRFAVILVLPNPCRLLSRELLYTALTRQRNHIVVLHQGPRSELKRFASDAYSETARRLTNLFQAPSPVEVAGRFYEDRLIHRTLREELVRSKSEVIIANMLHERNIDYVYEKELQLGGESRYPDFTIEDDDSGLVYYWEHCGMLHDPEYRARWELKLGWYKKHGIVPHEEGGERHADRDSRYPRRWYFQSRHRQSHRDSSTLIILLLRSKSAR